MVLTIVCCTANHNQTPTWRYIEGGGKLKYLKYFCSQTFMGGKGRWRYVGVSAYIVFGLLTFLLDDLSKTRSVAALRPKGWKGTCSFASHTKELSSNHWI